MPSHLSVNQIFFTEETWKNLLESLKESNEYIFRLYSVYAEGPAFDTEKISDEYEDYANLKSATGSFFRIIWNGRDLRSLSNVNHSHDDLISQVLCLRVTNSQRRTILSSSYDPGLEVQF